jgi:hypothetical protein
MKKSLIALMAMLALVALFFSCNFDFDGNDDLNTEPELIEVRTDFTGGYRIEWFLPGTGGAADVLQRYEDHFVTGDRDVQVQYFNAAGAIQHTYLYQWTGEDNTLIAYFDAANALVWYRAMAYTDGLVDVMREYDASASLQWARRYVYGGGADDAGLTLSALYASDLSLQEATVTLYVDDLPSKETSYAAAEAIDEAVAPRTAVSGATGGPAPRAYLALTAPVPPAMPVLVLPDAETIVLPVTGYRFWFYDSMGTTELAFSPSWYPLSVARSDDSRIPEDISVELEYDDANIPVEKRIYYGSHLALDAVVTYDEDGFPLTLATTGEALVAPLSYDVVYDDNKYVTRLNVTTAEGALLHYFTYDTEDFPDVPVTLDAAESFDIFGFYDGLLGADLYIHHYDGDGVEVERFHAYAAEGGSGVRIDVEDPADDYAVNGYFLALYDADGQRVSFASYSAAGLENWSYAYAYGADYDAIVAEATLQYGRLSEMFDLSSIEELASAFWYDIIL